jgi:hypothetical protein
MSVFVHVGDRVVAAAASVEQLDGRYLALALGLQLAALALRAFGWRGVLSAAYPDQRIPLVSVGCAYAAGVALNAYLPARGGEGAKVLLARMQIPGSSVPTLAASLSVIMVADAILGALLVVAFWATGALPALPSLPAAGLAPVALALAGGAAVALAIAAHRFGAALRRMAASAVRGFAVLRSPSLYVKTVLPFQLGAWACRIGVVYLVLQAFRIDAGLETAALVVVLNGAATAVPVPGGAGSQQVLATYALQGAISTVGAMAFSLSMQAGVTVVNTLVGVAAAMFLFRTVHPVRAVRAVRTR